MSGLVCVRSGPRNSSVSDAHQSAYQPRTSWRSRPSRMELELCFEDVARNVFGNEDGTMTRCVSVVSVAPPPHGWDVESPIGSVFVSSRRIRPSRVALDSPPATDVPDPVASLPQASTRGDPRRGHRPRAETRGAQGVHLRIRRQRASHRGGVLRDLLIPRVPSGDARARGGGRSTASRRRSRSADPRARTKRWTKNSSSPSSRG